MRQGYLLGSAVAVLLVGGTAALMLPHSSTPPGGRASTQAALSQGGAAPAIEDRAAPSLVPPSKSLSLTYVGVVPHGTEQKLANAESKLLQPAARA